MYALNLEHQVLEDKRRDPPNSPIPLSARRRGRAVRGMTEAQQLREALARSAVMHTEGQAVYEQARKGVESQIHGFIEWSTLPRVQACAQDGYCLMHVLVFNLSENLIQPLLRRNLQDASTFAPVTLPMAVL